MIKIKELKLSAQIIMNNLKQKGYNIEFFDKKNNIIKVYKKNKYIYTKGSILPINNIVNSFISTDKYLTNLLLTKNNIATTIQKKCNSIKCINEFASLNKYPFVIKPINLAHGTGVITNIKNKKDLIKLANNLLKKFNEILIECQAKGDDYRLLVADYKFISAIKRIPARVIGDGENTIKKLIDIENKNPLRGECYLKPLLYIKIDQETKNILKKNNLNLNSIPKKGEIIILKTTANQSKGGETENVTKIIHQDFIKLAQDASKALLLPYAGIDVLALDITKPISKDNGVIIEVNSSPGIDMHQYPSKGEGDKIGKPIVDMIEKYCFK